MYKLVIADDEGKTTTVPLVREEITIGRKEGNTIRLTERNVSRRHARLEKQAGHYVLHDLGSYNGIVINNRRLTEAASLKHGDQIMIGDYKLAILEEATTQIAVPPPPSNESEATVPALSISLPPPTPVAAQPPPTPNSLATTVPTAHVPMPPPPPAASAPPVTASASGIPDDIRQMRLVFLSPAGVPAPVRLDKLPIILGRSEAADVSLPFSSISREHARIWFENGELWVEDLGSSNGITINGTKTPRGTIAAGDIVVLGVVEFRVADRGNSTMMLTAHEMDVPARPNRTLIFALIGLVIVLGALAAFFAMRTPASTASPAGAASAPQSLPAPSASPTEPSPALPAAAAPLAAAPTGPLPTPVPGPAAVAMIDPPAAPAAALPPTAFVENNPPPTAAARSTHSSPPDRGTARTPSAATRLTPIVVPSPSGGSNPSASATNNSGASGSGSSGSGSSNGASSGSGSSSGAAHVAAPASTGSSGSSGSSGSGSSSGSSAASSGLAPIDEARACLRRGDNQCAITALRGHAQTEPEIAMLATTYRAMGNRADAIRTMQRYLQRFPDGPRAGSFRSFTNPDQ